MWTKFIAWVRVWAGNIWGKTTTLLLAASGIMGGVLAVPAVHDLLAGFPWFPYLTAAVGLLGFLGRLWAPPPPAVPIQEGTSATVNEATNTITLQPAAPLSDAVIQAAAKQPDVQP